MEKGIAALCDALIQKHRQATRQLDKDFDLDLDRYQLDDSELAILACATAIMNDTDPFRRVMDGLGRTRLPVRTFSDIAAVLTPGTMGFKLRLDMQVICP